MLEFYNSLAERKSIETQEEIIDWQYIFDFYGDMADDVKKLNFPENIIDEVDKEILKNNWDKIVNIIHSVPDYEECKNSMQKAGCKITIEDIGKTHKLFNSCVKYSPYMRKRLTLLRLKNMIVNSGL